MKESLSALCDGECDELEVRRVLNQVGANPVLREQWQRYHLIGAMMRGEPSSSVDLLKGINQALDGEPMDEVPASYHQVETAVNNAAPKSNFSQWFVSGAVAASVTLAVLAAFRMTATVDGGLTPAVAVQNTSAAAMMADSGTQVASADELREGQEALQQYIFASQSPANVMSDTLLKQSSPYARVANYGKETEVSSEN